MDFQQTKPNSKTNNLPDKLYRRKMANTYFDDNLNEYRSLDVQEYYHYGASTFDKHGEIEIWIMAKPRYLIGLPRVTTTKVG